MKIEILEEKKIKYLIKISKAKKIRIRFDTNAVLVITHPLGCKEESVVNFIEKNIQWILDKHQIASEKIVSYENFAYQFVFGKKVQLIINYSKTRRIDCVGDKLMISTPKIETVRNDLMKWRLNHAQLVFQELLYKCFNQMKNDLIKFPFLDIKKSKSKWGCCYFNENRIMLNIALTQVPFYLIEYVIYHELTHFIYHNHSTDFHHKLNEYVPNERAIGKELKQYPNVL